jgi:uncharacterized coiled-coil protein SlyX
MYPIQSLAGVVVAIERHRRQMARLLDGLDDIDRAAVSDGAPAPAAGRTDVSTLVSHLAGHLRLADIRLRRLADELGGQMPSNLLHQPREEKPHAHALRPLP